jgi:hypothetical protein
MLSNYTKLSSGNQTFFSHNWQEAFAKKVKMM